MFPMPPSILLLVSIAVVSAAGPVLDGRSTSSMATQTLHVPDVRPPAADIAAALQASYDRVKDFTASFTQVYEGGVLRRKAVESGTVAIRKPGLMRWEYTSPQKKLFVSDGKTMYMYFPEDRQVMTSPMPDHDEATSAVLFLMGRGDVTRDFTARWVEGGAPDEYAVRLEPRIRQAEYDWLEVTARRDTLQIRALTAGDAQGGRSVFTFTNLKENVGLADKLFQFSIPRGTEVITGGKTP
jgi:outer membrane lipoprotein carrier protein